MTIDTVVAYDVVTPAGKILHVTNVTDPDLFFALRVRLVTFLIYRLILKLFRAVEITLGSSPPLLYRLTVKQKSM